MLWHVQPAGMMVSAKTGQMSKFKLARLALKIASYHWDRMVTEISWMSRDVPKTQEMTLRWEAVCISLKTLASNTRSTKKFAFVIRTNVTITDACPSFVAALFPIPIIVETSRNVSIHHCVSHDSFRWIVIYWWYDRELHQMPKLSWWWLRRWWECSIGRMSSWWRQLLLRTP